MSLVPGNNQEACYHPLVAETGHKGQRIGLDAGAARVADHIVGRELCGPAGRWHQARTQEAA